MIPHQESGNLCEVCIWINPVHADWSKCVMTSCPVTHSGEFSCGSFDFIVSRSPKSEFLSSGFKLGFLFSDIICQFPSQLFLVTTKRLRVASIVRIDRSSSVNTNATDINKVGELFHKY